MNFDLRRLVSGFVYYEIRILFLHVFTHSVVVSLSIAFCFRSCVSFVSKSGFVLKDLVVASISVLLAEAACARFLHGVRRFPSVRDV